MVASDGRCDEQHAREAHQAQLVAEAWRGKAREQLAAFIAAARERAEGLGGRSRAVPLGDLHRIINALETHFAVTNGQRVTARTPADAEQIITWARFANRILGTLSGLVIGVPCFCVATCGRTHSGTLAPGCAVPGSGSIKIVPALWDRQHPKSQAGIVLHEALHASAREFNDDSYRHEPDYPGNKPFANADSYACLVAELATGSDFRITMITDPLTIQGKP